MVQISLQLWAYNRKLLGLEESNRETDPRWIFRPIIVTTKYKLEKVLIDQGSSASKLGLPKIDLEECLDTLIRYAGKQIEIYRVISLETTFGVGPNAKTITGKFMVINT
ncbi:hypothetical protein CR513_02811, partial [Mucuna pruriens]